MHFSFVFDRLMVKMYLASILLIIHETVEFNRDTNILMKTGQQG
jgi:hypothetical protein